MDKNEKMGHLRYENLQLHVSVFTERMSIMSSNDFDDVATEELETLSSSSISSFGLNERNNVLGRGLFRVLNIRFIEIQGDHHVDLENTSVSSIGTTRDDETEIAEMSATTCSESTIVNELGNALEQL